MRLFISLLIVIIAVNTAMIIDITVNGVQTDLFSPENVERVRQNIPKNYKSELSLTEPEQVVVDPAEVECLQKNLYFEARNQGVEGQLATAWVTINRVNSVHYPSTICDVVYQGVHDRNGNPVRNQCKFSWYCDGLSDKPSKNPVERRAWKVAGEIARHMIENCTTHITEVCPDDPTNGALYYHTKEVAPKWSEVYTVSANIGSHIFYTRN